MLQSVLCITTNKYLVRVLVVLLHACFSVVSPIPFLLATFFFFSGHPYIGSTTVLPDIIKHLNCIQNQCKINRASFSEASWVSFFVSVLYSSCSRVNFS